MNEDKIAVCIQGGGGDGRFAIEVLAQLVEKIGFRWDAAFGVSVGGIVAALSSTLGPRRGCELWDANIGGFFDVFSPRLIAETGLVTAYPLEHLLEKFMTGVPFKTPCTVGMTDWDFGRYHDVRVDGHPNMIGALMASSAIPILVKPVKNDGIVPDTSITEFCDGGTTHLTPLREAVRQGFGKILVICCHPNTEGLSKFQPTELLLVPEIQLAERAVRALQILMHQAMLDDLVWQDAQGTGQVKDLAPVSNSWSSIDFTKKTNVERVAEATRIVDGLSGKLWG
jgi:predicted acylesterase/phospholipase RssA